MLATFITLKCIKTHLRACIVQKFFPGVIAPDPHIRGGEGRGREGEAEGWGREGRGRGKKGPLRRSAPPLCETLDPPLVGEERLQETKAGVIKN